MTTDQSKHPPENAIPSVDKNAMYARLLKRLSDARERERARYVEWRRENEEVQYLCEIMGIDYDAHPEAGITKGPANKLWRMRMIIRILRESTEPLHPRAVHEEMVRMGGRKAAGTRENTRFLLDGHPDRFEKLTRGLYVLAPRMRESLAIETLDQLFTLQQRKDDKESTDDDQEDEPQKRAAPRPRNEPR